ncbi:MAG: metalloregulator ArsR/SmtB family transcription factor [Candidatus Paceibacterota bacterium]
MIEAKQFKKVETSIKAIANYRRLAIVSLLKKNGEMSVGDIAEELKISIQAISKHLKLLERADILSSDQRGLLVYYFLNKPLPNFVSNIVSTL